MGLDTSCLQHYSGAVQSKLANTLVLAEIFFIVCRSFGGELETRCAQAEKHAIDYLASTQRLTGGFTSYEWVTLQPAKRQAIETPFTVSQVVYSLSFCGDDPNARTIRERAAGWLARERESPGVWRYHGTMDKLPPDADDTAMGWVALQRVGYTISPEGLAAVRSNRNGAGLFNTWMGDPSAHVDSREIDSVVNLNALLLFSLADESLDTVCAYLVKQVDRDAFVGGSVYYPSQWSFAYAFSRAYADGGVDCLKPAVPKIRERTLSLQKDDGGWGSDYETVLALLTLLNLGERGPEIQKTLDVMIRRQMPDGGWGFEAAYTGADRSMSYGSRAVTTGLCVEAFAKYLRH